MIKRFSGVFNFRQTRVNFDREGRLMMVIGDASYSATFQQVLDFREPWVCRHFKALLVQTL